MSRQDGDLDIFWGASDDADLSTGVNKVDRNDGGGAFVAISDGVVTAEFVTSSNPVNVNAFCDFDGDGDIDIAQWQETSAGRMFRNDGALTFTAVTNGFTAASQHPTTFLAWGDYDNVRTRRPCLL